MKRTITLPLAFLLALLVGAQGGTPYCIWEDPNTNGYYFSKLNAANGALNTIAIVPGMDAFVGGNKTAFNGGNGRYYFSGLTNGQIRFYTIDATNGAVLNDPLMPDNVVGIEYDHTAQMLYGLREAGNNYDLVSIQPDTWTLSTIGAVPDVSAYVSETFSLDQHRGRYTFVALFGGTFHLRTYDLADASLIADVPFPDPLVGHRYNCQDSSIYALWETAGQYKLERIQTNGTHATVAALAGVTPGFVANSASMEMSGIYTYRGFNANNAFALISINVATGAIVHNTATLDNATGFEEANWCNSTVHAPGLSSPASLEVHPQPAADRLFIGCTTPIREVRIHSLIGGVVRTMAPRGGAGEVSIDLHGLVNGGYLLEVVLSDGRNVRRSIIKAGQAAE